MDSVQPMVHKQEGHAGPPEGTFKAGTKSSSVLPPPSWSRGSCPGPALRTGLQKEKRRLGRQLLPPGSGLSMADLFHGLSMSDLFHMRQTHTLFRFRDFTLLSHAAKALCVRVCVCACFGGTRQPEIKGQN